jgi:hypothetical protein
MNADLNPEEPIDFEFSDREPDPDELEEPSDLDFSDMPCTDEAGRGSDESQWEAFLPDDDGWDPEPDPGDFWIENAAQNLQRAPC